MLVKETVNLEDYVLDRTREIDREAQLQKNGVRYVAVLILDEPQRFSEAFGVEEANGKLCELVEEEIQRLLKSKSLGGISPLNLPNKVALDNVPAFHLGWIIFRSIYDNTPYEEGKGGAYIDSLTERGRKVLDKYREVQGIPTNNIDDSVRALSKAYHGF